jgi:DNA segregation ATPase FtsK/SpoIIIE-like protein
MKARYQYLQDVRKDSPEKTFESVRSDKHLPQILLILDEGASIVASLSKKEQTTYLKELQQLAQMGRAANISLLLAFQQPNALSLPTSIRDQLTGLKVVLGSLSQISPETKRMVFGSGVDLLQTKKSNVGTGYIWLEGSAQPETFSAPELPQEADKLYKLCSQALVNQKNLKLA